MTQQPQAKYRHDYRAPDYQITDIDLTFDLDAQKTVVTAVSQAVRHGASDAPLRLNGEDLKLVSVHINDEPWTAWKEEEGALVISNLPERFTLKIINEISPAANTALEGLYQSGDALCTQCEAEGFRHITYYLDRPDVLARFTTKIIADKTKYPFLLSNGNRVAQGELENGRHWVQWQDPFPKPCYLFALVAGDFDVLRDTFTTRSGREVALELYVDRGNLDRAPWAMTSLKNSMKWDEERFGLEYDLDIYMIVAVDFFNMGAMENKGLNIFNSKYVLARTDTATDKDYLDIERVIGHEYFHNWTGNRVTCRDWFQLSLKEGFTVFRDAEFSADMGSRTVKRIDDVSFLRTVQFAEDAGPMAHSVRPDAYMEISNFYTVTIYEKGAEVVRMIRELVGPAAFRKGSDLYFERHDGQAVTTEDFVKAMEDASGVDLTQFRLWYSQAGTPVLRVKGEFDAARSVYTLTVEQSCPPTPEQPEKLPMHIPLRVALLDRDGNEVPLADGGSGGSVFERVLDVTRKSQQFVFDGIAAEPVPSLLRGFSAPVKLQMDYGREDLQFLMAHDTDGFNRWNAAQQLGVEVLQELLADYQAGRELVLEQGVIDAFASVLQASIDKSERDDEQDKAAVAQLLTLPAEAYLSELADEIDVVGIHAVREFACNTLAKALEKQFTTVYQLNSSPEPYAADADGIARRALKNTCLGYLMRCGELRWLQVCNEQFETGDNMTDVSAALKLLVNSEMPEAEALREQALRAFYEKWQHEALVVDQWFSVQASSVLPGTLDHVKKLMQHPAFDIKNPNKVRALISAFANGNPVQFHDVSGSGYEFLADRIIELDGLNPQIASRLVTPLSRWRKFGEERQQLMRKALERVAGVEELSKDVREVVGKSLR